jgi:hypothetical protein
MKKIIYLLIFIAVILSGNMSCTKKIDEAFANPNATVRVPVETLLPGIIGNMVGNSSAAGSAYGTANDGLYVGRYVQFWGTNTSGNQFDQMGGATGASDLLGSVWAMHYYGMGQNLNKMVDWSIEEKKWDYVGVGYAIRAWGWLNLTDMHGDVILREAFNTSQLVFKYNEQKDVYDTVRTICRIALEYLNKSGDNVSQANLAKGDQYFNNGDNNKWKKFVYAVMARSFHHLSNKADYQPDSVLFYCNLAMNTNADNAVAKFANTGITGTSNFYGPFRSNVGTLRQSAFAANLLSGLNTSFTGVNDPRAWYILRENTNNTFKGVSMNKGSTGLATNDQPKNFWGGTFATTGAPTSDATCRYIFKNGAPFPIITASEIQFMKAEALYLKGNKNGALAAYKEGISLSLDLLTTAYNVDIPPGKEITPAIKTSFLNDPLVVPAIANFNLSHIMLQKYIALYGYGMLETWVDMRRYHYVDPEPGTSRQVYTDFIPPSGIDLFSNNNSKLVYRARPRYNSEYIYNVDELNRLGAIDLDYHTKEQWFSKKQ